MVVELRHFLFGVLLLPFTLQAQSILQRHIEVDAQELRLSEALSLIAQDADFKLSYNALTLNGDSIVSMSINGTVEQALHKLTGDGFDLKETREHIILLRRAKGRKKFTVTGSVTNDASGDPLPLAYLHAVSGKDIVATNNTGAFNLPISSRYDPAAILITRKSHHDTVVYVHSDQQEAPSVALRKRTSLEVLEPLCVYDRCEVSDLGVTRVLVSQDQLDMQEGLSIDERRKWQITLVPGVSSNRDIAPLAVNEFSFNVLAGYSRGLEGLEIGFFANLETHNVRGVQVAGFANLVGGTTRGVQIAGGGNHTMRSMHGGQFAFGANVVWDTLVGLQFSGAANVVKGKMTGTQISFGVNAALQDVDGVQWAGAVNFTPKTVNKAQVSNGLNYAKTVNGAQVANGLNFVLDSLNGVQVATGVNMARFVKGSQIGVVNIAQKCYGAQIGIVNFSDSISGIPIGLISISRRGYHRVDAFVTNHIPFTLQLRTGVRNFHNTFSFSPNVDKPESFSLGYGFGSEPKLSKRSSLDIQLNASYIIEQAEWTETVNLLTRLNIGYSFNFGRYLAIYAGPAIHFMISDWRDPEGNFLSEFGPGDPPIEIVKDNTRMQSWYGFHAGVGLRF